MYPSAEPVCTYKRKENKAAAPTLPPPSQHQKKPIERKQHELQVMARVYCFLTFHLMPTKLIPWFQQVEYVVHRLQLNLHAPEPLASCRHASQQIEENTWCAQKSHCEGGQGCIPGKGRATSLGCTMVQSGQMAVTSLRLSPVSKG